MTNTQIELQNLSEVDAPEDQRKISSLAETINVGSIAAILEFGSEAVNKTNALTDQILSRAQASDLGETGGQLTKIVVTAQEFDFDALANPWAKIPVLGGLLKQLNSTRAKAMAKFENVKSQVDRLVATVERTAATLSDRDKEYSAIYNEVRSEYQELGLYVAAIHHRLNGVQAELADSKMDPSNLESIERASVLEAARDTLSKRADDLEVVRHSAMQTLPMIRIIQSNNYALVDKFTTIRTLTLPAWKRAFMMAISIAEQKDANDLATSIDDTTNALLRRNAELLKQNSIAVAKSSQRLVIDVETLKSVHANIITTLQEVRKVHADGAGARSSAIKELGVLREELANAVGNTAKNAA